ncbi:MAG: CBS and ACT domain-containing protein [Gemmatimonadota bacterium]|jgi:acetoin utilization protein AcuB|nr:CBS and ACT domain-containing protein [Gemmatimonadota bacterium]
MLVRDHMRREVITVSPDDTLAAALRITRGHRIRHLPVVLGDNDLIGILSDRDIRLAMPSPLTVPDSEQLSYLEKTPVAMVMTREVIAVGEEETLEDAAKLLYSHRIGALPVVDASNRVRGILSETDILRSFTRILGVSRPSSRVELRLPDRPGALGRALIILSEHGLNIMSLILPPNRVDGMKVAVIHLETIDPREAIEALEAAGFEAGWPSLAQDLRKLDVNLA